MNRYHYLCAVLVCLAASAYVVIARPPPFYEQFSRICGQGQKVFTFLQFKENPDSASSKTVLLPRCIGLEPPACTRGCRWLENCDLSPGKTKTEWEYDNGAQTFVAGFNTILYPGGGVSKIEAWCCQSLSSQFYNCEWRKPIYSQTPTAVAGNGEIVRNIRTTDEGDLLGSLEVEVCKVETITDICPN